MSDSRIDRGYEQLAVCRQRLEELLQFLPVEDMKKMPGLLANGDIDEIKLFLESHDFEEIAIRWNELTELNRQLGHITERIKKGRHLRSIE